MSQLFNRIRVAAPNRSTFDLSHHQVTTSDFGYIVPICYRDMVPNDDFTVTPNIFVRLAPLAVPTYGRIKVRVHHFFVPYRILYPHWDAFITQDSSNNTIPPYFTVSTLQQALTADPQYNDEISPTSDYPRGIYSRLMANLGLNPILINDRALSANERFSAFPFLAYYRIWLDYFADPSINDHPTLVAQFNDWIKDGGSMALRTSLLQTRYACYKKDYFTTAKINPQDGSASVVPVDVADVNLNPSFSYNTTSNTLKLSSSGSVVVDPSQSSNSFIGGFTVEALRAADSLQRYLERNNFVGTKIINRILAHFGVQPNAERLDMAEFLGGDSMPIAIGDVTKTGNNTSTNAISIGTMAGKGVGAKGFKPVSYHAKEHGIFMSLMSIMPDTGYYQCISRFWQKGVYGDALDYFTPEFENLGYQEILNKEVFVPSADEYDGVYQGYDHDGIFGYTPRYSEYKFQNDVLAGDFVGQSRDGSQNYSPNNAFHLFRDMYFTDYDPLALNNNFVELNNHVNTYDRIFQVTSTQLDHFYFNIDVNVKATRPMQGFAAPTLTEANQDGKGIDLPYGGSRL